MVEYRAAMDSTLPPTPLKQLLSAGGANVFVLSVDQTLIDTVQLAAGEQYPVYMVSAWSELQAAIDSGRCGIALIDAGLLADRLAKRLAELERHSGRLVILVAADRSDAQELIGYLSDRKIHRLLIKPPALGITRLLLESAVSRSIQLREQASDAEPPMRSDLRPRSTRASAAARWPSWVLAIALASLVVGVLVAAGLTRSMWQPAPLPPAPSSVAAAPRIVETLPAERVEAVAIATTDAQPLVAATPAPIADPFGDSLVRAQAALDEGRLALPVGDSALDDYMAILAAEPTHAEARAGLAGVVDALFTQVEAALLADSLDLVAATLASVRRADPGSSRLAFLTTQLELARARAADEQTSEQAAVTVALPAPSPEAPQTPASQPQPPSELDSLLAIAAVRLERGELLQPAGNSAREYIERAAALNPDDQRVVDARAALAAAVAAAARVSLNAADLQGAERLLGEARRLRADPEALTILDLEIAAVREQRLRQRHSSLFTAAQERLSRGELIEPEQDSALFLFVTLRTENPRYPDLTVLERELTDELVANTRTAFDRRDWASAQSWLGALATIDADSSAAAELSEELQSLRLQEQYLAAAAPASELLLLSFEPPAYPADALRNQIEGWVELEFIVGRDGRPRELVPVSAEPVGRFEQAAIVAVAQYLYAPFELDGKTYDRRVRLRVRFALQ